MRYSSMVRSPEPAEPQMRMEPPKVVDQKRVDSSSSNSTSSSGPRPRAGGRVDLSSALPESDGRKTSLQEAFAARRRLAREAETEVPEDDNPFVSLPKIALDRSDTNYGPPIPPESLSNPFDEVPAVAGSRRANPIPDVAKPRHRCPHCDRMFNIDVIDKHIGVCASQKKRSTYDSKNHRLAGITSSVPNRPLANEKEASISVKKASWREKSDQLRAAIGVARATDPMERKKFEDDLARVNQAALTRCEFCGRSFNADAAQRHIPICRAKAAIIPRSVPGRVSLGGTGASISVPKVTKLPPINQVPYKGNPIVLNAKSATPHVRSSSSAAPPVGRRSERTFSTRRL